MIPSILVLAKQKQIHVEDPIGIECLCAGLCLEAAKAKFTPMYHHLKTQFNLQDVRNIDDRSRVNE